MIPAKAFIILFFALIPAMIWLYMFMRGRELNKFLVLFTFIGGMIAAKLILIYQGYWDHTVNLIFFKVQPVDFKANLQNIFLSDPLLAVFLSFVGVGVVEEYAKFWIMRLINHNFFKSIDGVMKFAIISALGFSFFENMIYFLGQWGELSAGNFFVFALMRVTVVTMVHVLCSGILGYYFGMAFFASPMLKIQHMKKKRHRVLEFLNRVLHLKKSHVYHDQMFMTGLVLSMLVHGLYDFLLTINVTIAGIPLVVPVILVYFFGGFWFLSTLLNKKELNLKLGLVGTSIMPKEDFVKLLGEVQELKKKMRKSKT